MGRGPVLTLARLIDKNAPKRTAGYLPAVLFSYAQMSSSLD
jgi:hypothetical protein